MATILKWQKRVHEGERLAVEWGLLGALLAALGVKLWLVFSGDVPFNADEAVVALMARHIQAGARPVFFYGQAYMGSLDAFFVAGGFEIFGQQIWVIRLIQVVLYLLTIVTSAWLGREVFGSWSVGVLAAWFLAFPPVNVALYTTASLGNYGEALLIGNLILITGLRIANHLRQGRSGRWGLWGIWGVLTGLGMWTFGLTLVYSLPVGFILVWLAGRNWLRNSKETRNDIKTGLGATASGLVLGSFPWLVSAWRADPGLLVRELGGGGIAGVEGLSWFGSIWQHIINFIVLGSTVILGLRPPWEVRWLAWPLLPFALAFWLSVIVFIGWKVLNKHERRFESGLLASVGLIVDRGFHFYPVWSRSVGPLFSSSQHHPCIIRRRTGYMYLKNRIGSLAIGLPILIMAFNLWGTVQCCPEPSARSDHSI